MATPRNYTTHWFRRNPYQNGDAGVWCGAVLTRPDKAAFGACHVTCRACKVARRDGMLLVRGEFAERRETAMDRGLIDGSPDERAARGLPLTFGQNGHKVVE